jgi:CheY-like chemotaxis protein
VLVVDDDDAIGTFTERVLRRSGYRTRYVGSAEAALDCLAEGRWDGLLTDLRLPGMDGLELAHTARHRYPALGIALMTAFIGTVGSDDLERCGVDQLIPKPLVPEDLTDRMARLLPGGDECGGSDAAV